jgi:hypothetical protein
MPVIASIAKADPNSHRIVAEVIADQLATRGKYVAGNGRPGT